MAGFPSSNVDPGLVLLVRKCAEWIEFFMRPPMCNEESLQLAPKSIRLKVITLRHNIRTRTNILPILHRQLDLIKDIEGLTIW